MFFKKITREEKKTEVEINILQSMIKHNHIDVIWWKLYIRCWICAYTLWCMSIWLSDCYFQFKNEKKNGKKIRAKTLTPQSAHNILSAKSKKHHNQIQSSWISIWECWCVRVYVCVCRLNVNHHWSACNECAVKEMFDFQFHPHRSQSLITIRGKTKVDTTHQMLF